MSLEIILILIYTVLCILVVLCGSILIVKFRQQRRSNLIRTYMNELEGVLNELLYSDDPFITAKAAVFAVRMKKRKNSAVLFEVIENILLACIDGDDEELAARAIRIAYDLDIPSKCLRLIKSYRSVVIASGCKKAALYKYADAIPGMLDALSVFSSDTQMEILLALSAIGDADAIEQAFDKIQDMMFINERGISEVMLSFTGNKVQLYSHMIAHSSDYVSSLFLKALDADSALALHGEILDIMCGEGKEKRISAIRALGKTKSPELSDYFIAALSDPDWEVRSISAKILGDIIVPDAGEHLAKAVCDREWWVRQNAATSLLRYPGCEELFYQALQTRDKYARDSILYALNNTQDDKLAKKISMMAAETEDSPIISKSYEETMV